MKRKHIKSLKLNKRKVVHFKSSIIFGGNQYESVRICEAPITDTCSINNADCNYTGDGSASPSVRCHTQIPEECNPNQGGTSNLTSPC